MLMHQPQNTGEDLGLKFFIHIDDMMEFIKIARVP